MKAQTPQLTKGGIKQILASLKSEMGKPHLFQAFDTKKNALPQSKASKTTLKISDGCYFIRAVISEENKIQNFDILSITELNIGKIKQENIVIITKFAIAYTGITGTIGKPVEVNQVNKLEATIVPIIPPNAKMVSPSVAPKSPIAPSKKPESIKKQMPPKKKEEVYRDSSAGCMPLKALGLSTSEWKIKVRLTRLCEPKTFNKSGKIGNLQSFEIIDEDGTEMSGTIFGDGIEKFKSILHEGSCYIISYGSIRLARHQFTTVKNDYSLSLDSMSSIIEAEDDIMIPMHAERNYTQIAKITDLPVGAMVDVVGSVRAVSEISKITGKDRNTFEKRVITVFDESGKAIECTLWRAHAQKEVKVGDIIVLRGVKVGEFNGKQLGTSTDSVITINPGDGKESEIRDW